MKELLKLEYLELKEMINKGKLDIYELITLFINENDINKIELLLCDLDINLSKLVGFESLINMTIKQKKNDIYRLLLLKFPVNLMLISSMLNSATRNNNLEIIKFLIEKYDVNILSILPNKKNLNIVEKALELGYIDIFNYYCSFDYVMEEIKLENKELYKIIKMRENLENF